MMVIPTPEPRQSKYLVKLFSPWHKRDLVFGDVCFSPTSPLEATDAALWEYWPDESTLSYRGPKAWYSWEPNWHGKYRSSLVRRAKAELDQSEWLHYAHPKECFRVPHITNCGDREMVYNVDRRDEAVAIVSNCGGRVWYLRSGLRLRNRFVTHSMVRLHGRRVGWAAFRQRGPFSRPALPANYCGELDWANGWMAEEQVAFLGTYKVAVCLENSREPYYFTEKFLNAARAGCVPVYHAHETVRHGVLRGAYWIEPADYGFDPARTIQAALNAPLYEAQETNRAWMRRAEVQATHFDGVWNQLAAIFATKIETSRKSAALGWSRR